MTKYILTFALFCFIFSCNEKSNEVKKSIPAKTETTQKTIPPTNQPIKVQGKKLYPSVPVELIESLWNNCDYADFSFNNIPVSMNQQELKDIRHSLAQISNEPAFINNACPELGRVLFYQNAEIALEGIIYFSQGCTYFVFVENNKPKYANFMTPAGVKFYNNILSQFNGKQ